VVAQNLPYRKAGTLLRPEQQTPHSWLFSIESSEFWIVLAPHDELQATIAMD
jgi:hypothetical protein